MYENETESGLPRRTYGGVFLCPFYFLRFDSIIKIGYIYRGRQGLIIMKDLKLNCFALIKLIIVFEVIVIFVVIAAPIAINLLEKEKIAAM